nr:putative ribonuclease H-like domain-containing protein [Tanacetum cinerariifolium]
MKDLGRLKYFLRIKVLRSQHGIFICQKKYILDLLAETGMIDCKPAETPMIVNQKLYIDDEAKTIDKDRYQQMIITPVAQAEFRGIAKGVAEALWIRKLLSEVGYPPKEVTRIMCDNKAAIQISKNPVQHDRTKHVEIDRHFIKEKLEAGIIKLPFVKSQDQLADILTKSVGAGTLQECLSNLNFGNPTIQLKGEARVQSQDFFIGHKAEDDYARNIEKREKDWYDSLQKDGTAALDDYARNIEKRKKDWYLQKDGTAALDDYARNKEKRKKDWYDSLQKDGTAALDDYARNKEKRKKDWYDSLQKDGTDALDDYARNIEKRKKDWYDSLQKDGTAALDDYARNKEKRKKDWYDSLQKDGTDALDDYERNIEKRKKDWLWQLRLFLFLQTYQSRVWDPLSLASPAGVLELDTHSSSEDDPLESSPPPVSIAPMVLHFLCSGDLESDTEIPERHVSLTTSTLEILTTPILPAPSAIVAPPSKFSLAPVGIKAEATTIKVVVDKDVEAEIDVGIGMEVDVWIDVEDEVESSDRGTIEVRVVMDAGIDIPDGMLMPDAIEHLELVEEGLQNIHNHVIEIHLQRIEELRPLRDS